MIAMGVDVHKRRCSLAMQFEDGELASFAPIENTREGWLELLAVLPPEAEIALEVSTSGYFAMSVLEEAGWRERAHWVHTAGIDSLRKQKTDRLDARRLAQQALPAAVRESVEQILRLEDFLRAELEISEGYLRAVDPQFPELRRLRTIPGIGAILAPVIWSEMGRVERFASADAWVNYTGLVPRLYESGEVSVRGGITRQGSAWLRWALGQAANAVIQGDNPFARRYRRLRRRKLGNVAKTAGARSLARCV